ncbi:Rpn family recombination-promoting nuclease/putative transposase [Clostridium intestinale]|uniref:PD-(D/E)XK nuclease family transposase n=1 Tax=Clostridium intestinale DSM 6191 TaxID=1121320 RepID=A0A1M5WQF8_9CLOT|nr:Rpn family recombination-promoting nuclease/putative transposase [Clostridium intestinale]SHH89739.1 conserved hypothetical protein (putative transposase or invertase) [Clostridium intestinale DSM 6191]
MTLFLTLYLNKDILIDFLNSILKTPQSELEDIELINTELLREFSEERKGILDVRARTKSGEQIDIEIHYLELPKLFESNIKKDENEDIIQWLMFLEGKNKEGFEMLAEKNEKIKKAYGILEVISKDDIKRAAYEAREAELHDQMTRLKSAREEGRREEKLINAKKLILLGVDVEIVAKGVGLSIDEVKRLLV